MALTIEIKKRNVVGAGVCVVADIDFDSSYPTGGEALVPADLGFNLDIDLLLAEPTQGFSFRYDRANDKLLVLCPGVVTGAAGAGTLDDFPQSGLAATAASIGMTAGNATHRFGGQVEVANAVNLSTLTDVRVIAFGDMPYS